MKHERLVINPCWNGPIRLAESRNDNIHLWMIFTMVLDSMDVKLMNIQLTISVRNPVLNLRVISDNFQTYG